MRRLPCLLFLVALVLAISTAASAQALSHSQGPGLGTYSLGQVEIPLVASGGDGANYIWQLVGGALPPGMALRTDGASWFPPNARAGLIGIATMPGTYDFTLRVTSGGTSVDQNYELIISTLVVKDSYQVLDGFVGQPYSYSLGAMRDGLNVSATFAPNGCSYPNGISLDFSGVLRGTPTTPGSYNFCYSVSDGADRIYKSGRIDVYAVDITTGDLPNATVGLPYSATISASGGTGPYRFTSNQLPFGLTLDPSGSISGTLNSLPGRQGFNVTVSDSAGSFYTKLMSIDVLSIPPSLPQVLPQGAPFGTCSFGVSCSQILNVTSGGKAPFQWSAAGLPPGMSIRFGSGMTSSYVTPGDAEIWGSPTALGTFHVQVTVTDADGVTASNTFDLSVSPLMITNYLVNGAVGAVYTSTFRLIGGTQPYTASTVAGFLPAGVGFNGNTLTVSGTPLESGNFGVRIHVADADGNTYEQWVGFFISGTISINDYNDLGTFTIASPLFHQFFACCAPSIVWSVVDPGDLPHGLSVSSTGVLTGTPDTSGTYTFTLKAADATNASNASQRQFTITITPLSIATQYQLPFGNVGSPYGGSAAGLQLNINGGTRPYTWSLQSSSYLPPGLTLTPSGAITGTPTANGQFQFAVIVTDAAGNKGLWYFSLSIYPAGAVPPPAFNINTNLGTWSIGQVDGVQLRATGGDGTYTFSIVGGNPPPGLAIRTDGPSYFPMGVAGLIGVATTPGTYMFQMGVTSAGVTTVQTFTMKIVDLVVKDPFGLPDGFLGQNYSYQLTALRDGLPVAGTWTATGALPPGLSLSASGLLSGVPSATGFFNVNFSVSDGGDTFFRSVNVNLYAIDITTSGDILPNAIQNQPYSTPALTTVGGSGSYTYSVSGFTGGLSLNASTGVLSGNINAGTGTFSYTITATDTMNPAQSYRKPFTVTVVGPVPVLPQVTAFNNVISDCTIGVPCSRNFGVQSGGSAPFTWSADGLPRGMDIRWGSGNTSTFLSPTQVEVFGTPDIAGTYNITLTVTDALGVSASNTFALKVGVLVTTNGFAFGPVIETPYASQMRVIGGVPGYTATLTGGALPNGLALNGSTLTVSGTPHESGQFNPVLTYVDTVGNALQFSSGLFVFSAGPGTVSISTGNNLPVATLNSAYQQQLSGCCPSALSWSLASDPSSLPAGISLSASGVLSGTPTSVGTYTFTVRATDPANAANYAQRAFTLIVTPVSIATTSPLPFANVGSAYSATLTATGGTGPYNFTLAPFNVLPPGLTLNVAGGVTTLSGTPTVPGFFSFTINVSDSAAHFGTRTFNLSIYPAGQYPPLQWAFGSNFGPFAVGVVTIQLSGVSGGLPPYQYSISPTANPIAGMRIQSGQPLPTNFPTSVTAGYVGVIPAAGSYSTSIRVTDSLGNSIDRPITITVSPLHILSQFNLPKATKNVPYSFTLAPYPAGGTYTWSATNLPQGLSINAATGEISGTPTVATSASPQITLRTSTSSVTLTFSLVVNPFAISTDGVLPQGTVGSAYSTTLSAAGCGNPCNWTIAGNSLPGGLTLNNSTGTISGTPSGTFNGSFGIQASGSGGVVQKMFAVRVVASAPQALVITTNTSLGYSPVGSNVSQALFAQGGTLPYTWSIDSGTLPAGVALQGPGETISSSLSPGFMYLAGRVVDVGPGTYTFTIRVTDSAPVPASITQTVTWIVTPVNLQYFSLPPQFGNPPTVLTPLVYKKPYSQPLLALGGTGSYTWSLPFTPLPTGLQLDPATGVISGTPLNTGSFFVSIQAVDGAGAVVQSGLTLNIAGPTGTLLNFNNGSNFGTFARGNPITLNLNPSGGTGPYTITADTDLPPGFGIEEGSAVLAGGAPGATYLLAGTPLAVGTFSFTLEAQDTLGNVGARTFTIAIVPYTLLLSPNLPDASVGSPYSAPLLTTDTLASVTWTQASSLPPGLSLSGSAITGTPTAAGNYNFTLIAADSPNRPATSFNFSLHVSNTTISDPQILPIVPIAGSAITYTFTASGSGGVTWSSNGLPSALSLSPSGVLQSTGPTSAGLVTFSVKATSGGDSVTRQITLYIKNAIPTELDYSLALTPLADAVVGQDAAYSLTPTGGVPPYTWAVAPGSTLPSGLMLVAAADTGAPLPNGVTPGLSYIVGAPSIAGSYTFDLIVTDSTGAQARRTFTLNVTTINILPGSPRAATAGVAYTEQFTAVGGTAPYTFSMTPTSVTQDTLAPGLTLSANGVISGIPTSTGNYAFILHVQDSAGQTFARSYTLAVNNGFGLRVTSVNPFDRQVGTAGTQILTTNGASTYTWSVAPGSSLPDGLVLASGPPYAQNNASTVVVGQPRTPGVYTYTLRATDNANNANVADHTFTAVVTPMGLVSPPLTFLQQFVLPSGEVGNPYGFTFNAAGGTPPYTFTPFVFSPLPAGLTLRSDGLLSGTPQSVGNFAVGVTVTDATGAVLRVPNGFTLMVTQPGTPAPLGGSIQSLPDASVGAAYASPLDIYLRGGRAPFSWTVSSGSTLPPGLQVLEGGNGVSASVGGIPTTPGAYQYSLTVTDAAGQMATMSVTQNVSSIALALDTLPPAIVGTPYSAALTPSGGVGPYTIQASLAGGLPPGLTLNASGVLSGTPTNAGDFVVISLVNDSAGNSLTKRYRLTIDDAAGEAPAVTFMPNPIRVNYVEGAQGGASIPVTVGTTSGEQGFTLSVAGIAGASVAPTAGVTDPVVALNLDVAALGTGTYVGVLGMSAPASANQFDFAPIVLNVASAASDTTPPTLGAIPGDITLEATGPMGAIATFVTPTASDNFYPAPTVSVNPPSGSWFPVGTTIVTVKATDAAGNTAIGNFRVTVRDTITPTIEIAAPLTGVVYNVGQFVLPSFTCSDMVHVASCIGPTPEGVAIDTSTPGTFTFTVTAIDDSGNKTVASTTYTVVGAAPATAVDFEVLHNFAGADGSVPYAGLLQANDGRFYGTTYTGGAHAFGSIFTIDSTGALTTLYSFDGSNDGQYPYANLIQGADGAFYGTTSYGGANGYGTVFKVDASGNFAIVYTFSGTSDGAYPAAALVLGADGSLYGTTPSGGTNQYGTVFKIDPTGAFAPIHAFSYSDGANPRGSLVYAADGSLYGTTSSGGPASYGTVFRISPGGTLTVLHAFTYSDGGYAEAGLVLGADGHLYGTTYYGGPASYGTVFEISPGGTFKTLHSFSYNDGAYLNGGLVQGSDGALYGAAYSGGTTGLGTVFRIDAAGSFVMLHAFDGIDGVAPYGRLVLGRDGWLYGTTTGGGTSGGGTVFRTKVALGAAVPTSLALADAAGTFGDVTTLTATLTSSGTAAPGRTIAFTVNGAAVGSAVTDLNGVATLSRVSLAGIGAGSYPGVIQASFGGDVLVAPITSGTAALTVSKATPFVSWPAPAPIVEGTALDSTQLNATASVGGVFTYTPSAGTVLSVGKQQQLSVLFTPTDTADYVGAAANVPIDVVAVSSIPDSFEVLRSLAYVDGEYPDTALVQGTDGKFYGMTQYGGPSGAGTIFAIDAAKVFTIVHQLDYATEGGSSLAGLIRGTDGNFYGVASYGGPTGGGTIFKVDPSGSVTVLHAFVFAIEGAYPYASLVQGSDGSLYGTTTSGGPTGWGTVFRLNPDGSVTVLHAFDYYNDGANPYSALIQGADGSLYGTALYGGPTSWGTVFKVDQNRTFTVLHPFDYYTEGAYPYAGLLLGRDGNFYGVTSTGPNSGTVFKMTPSGTTTVVHAFDYANEGGVSKSSLIQDAAGVLYGTTSGGTPIGGGTMFKVDPSGAFSTLHVFRSLDGKPDRAPLTMGADGRLYGVAYSGSASTVGSIYRLAITRSELAVAQATGVYGDTTTLVATLTSSGSAVAGRTVAFTLSGVAVGSAPTDGSGTATLPLVGIAGTAAGTYAGAVVASFAGDRSYPPAANVADLVVSKRPTHLTWATPSDIIAGTPLEPGQLNAIADVPGTFVYSPAAGTILPVGAGQMLSVDFAPADSINYLPSAAARPLNVIDSSLGACVAPPNGLVGWWPAEGNAIDRVGLHPGTLQGSVAFASGRVGQGFSFDAPGSVRIDPSPSLDLTSMTIEGWVSYGSLPSGFGTIATKQDSRFINYSLFITSWGDLALYWVDAAGTHGVESSGLDISGGVFHHIAATVDGSRVRFYVDGLLAWDEPQLAPLVPVPAAPLAIGSEPASDQFYGAIDELAIYNRALSSDEVRAQYLTGVLGKCPPPSVLDVSSTVATLGGTTDIRAVFTSNGVPVAGKIVSFSLTDIDAGTATTDTSGVASVANVGVGALAAGTYPTAVTARFAGDPTYPAGGGTGALTIVDALGPVIAIAAPADGSVFVTGTAATASYTCADPSGVAICAGPAASGGNIDTSSLGPHVFTVTAKDTFGNLSSTSTGYTVIDLPRILVTAPTDPIYELGSLVLAQYSCTNAVTCNGDVQNGAALDTSTPGPKSFTINAVDQYGNMATQTVTYTVSLGACVAPFSNMTSWLAGDGTVVDEVGGTAAWTGATAYETGRVRQAFTFGSGAYVTRALTQPGSFTVQAWVRTTNPMLSPGTGILSTGVAGQESTSAQIELDGAGNYQLNVGNYDAVLFIGPASSSFQHVAVSYDQETGALSTYLNGQLVDYNTWFGSPDLGIQILNLGINRQGASDVFSGAIDEAQVFGRALTADEVLQTFEAGAKGLCKDPPPTAVILASSPIEATGAAGAMALLDGTSSSDPDGNTLTYTWQEGAVVLGTESTLRAQLGIGAHVITLVVDNGHKPSALATTTIVVQDSTAPAILGAPGDQAVEATSASGAVASWSSPTAIDSVDGAVAVFCAPASGSTFALGVTTVTCSSTDAHSNLAQVTFKVTVADTRPPELAGVSGPIVLEATGADGAVGSWAAPTAIDSVDGNVAVTCAPGSGTRFGFGTTHVECSATDVHGNRAVAGFDVTVQDTTAPALSGVSASLTLEAASASGAVGAWQAPTAVDLVDGAVLVTCAPASGSVFPIGQTPVACSAVDSHGNRSDANFNVRVLDTTGPALSLPVSAVAEATNSLGAIVVYAASATDAVSGSVPVACVPTSGATFAIGVTPVVCSTTDAAGNKSVGEFPVVVRDTTAPSGQILTPAPDAIISSSAITVTLQATDTVGVANVTINGVLATLTSGSPQSGTWSAFVPVAVAQGTAVVLQATVADAAGNAVAVNRVVDNDGIPSTAPPVALAPFALDRGRTTGTDQADAFSSEFNNGITSGTVTRNGWTMALSASPAPPRPLLVPSTAFWPSSGWVQVALSGAAAPAQAIVDACIGVDKQIRLNAVGERAAFSCDPSTGTIAVKALSASPTIEVWKQLSPNTWLAIPLMTGGGVSTGSPTTAFPDNPGPVDVRVVQFDGSGTSHVVGTFRLAPGTSADVATTLDSSGRESQFVFRALVGSVPVTIGSRVDTLAPGVETTVPIDRRPPGIDITAPRRDAVYVLNQRVDASFTCGDAGRGLRSCAGSSESGQPLATQVIGGHTFSVAAADHDGNEQALSIPYAVTYGIRRVDPVAAVGKRGEMRRLTVQLTDAAGVNVSDEAIGVRMRGAVSGDDTTADDVWRVLRFDRVVRAYVSDVMTPLTGTYQVQIEADNDPVKHALTIDTR